MRRLCKVAVMYVVLLDLVRREQNFEPSLPPLFRFAIAVAIVLALVSPFYAHEQGSCTMHTERRVWSTLRAAHCTRSLLPLGGVDVCTVCAARRPRGDAHSRVTRVQSSWHFPLW